MDIIIFHRLDSETIRFRPVLVSESAPCLFSESVATRVSESAVLVSESAIDLLGATDCVWLSDDRRHFFLQLGRDIWEASFLDSAKRLSQIVISCLRAVVPYRVHPKVNADASLPYIACSADSAGGFEFGVHTASLQNNRIKLGLAVGFAVAIAGTS